MGGLQQQGEERVPFWIGEGPERRLLAPNSCLEVITTHKTGFIKKGREGEEDGHSIP